MDETILATFGTHTVSQQAAMLGVSYSAVVERRSRLVRQGKIAWTSRAHNRIWTDAERQTVLDMLSDGAAIWRIARAVRRTPTAVEVYLKHHFDGVREARARNVVRTRNAAAVAALMGWVSAKRVVAHIQRGVLRGRRRSNHTRAEWLIDDVDLVAFLAHRPTWMAWEVATITDPDLRAEAAALRQAANGHWIHLADWCHAHHYTTSAGNKWIHAGLFTATARWNTHWYVWSTELATFVPPNERTRS